MPTRDRERDLPPFWNGEVPVDLAERKMLPAAPGSVRLVDVSDSLLGFVDTLPEYDPGNYAQQVTDNYGKAR